MKIKHVKFDHTAEGFYDAIGITTEMMVKCKERIFFSTFSNAIQSLELFEDRDEAPKELVTVTGDFQKTLSIIEDSLEYEYTLMEFMNTHNMAMAAVARWEFKNKAMKGNNKKKSMLLDIMDMVTELKMEHEKTKNEFAEENIAFGITPKGLLKRIEFTKSSHYDFDVYLNMVEKYNKSNNRNNDDNHSNSDDIDDFLRTILSQSDDDGGDDDDE